MKRLVAFLFVVLIAAAPSEGRAAAKGTVSGVVREKDGSPYKMATVLITKTHLGAFTDAEGKFTIRNVPIGAYEIVAKETPFVSAQRFARATVNVTAMEESRVELVLSEKKIVPSIGPDHADDGPDALLPLILIESHPLETDLDDPDIPDAADAWMYTIKSASTSLDFAEFYASDDPKGGGRLKDVIREIERAAKRGVRVRFLAEQSFYKTYPEILDRFAADKNITVRRLNSKAFHGGVQHAKYFIRDGKVAVIGSQNFDWRSLDHIQELGMIVDDPVVAKQLEDVFELDWDIAGRVPVDAGAGTYDALVDSLVAVHHEREMIPEQSGPGHWEFTASPTGRLPDESTWDEPKIVSMIDSAKDSLQVQLLTYRPVGRDSTYWDTFDNALRRAAARGVTVRLLLADWCKRKPVIDYIKSLSLWPGIEIRLMVIPQSSGGFVPFARVCHAKYMVVDGEKFWVGTGNWERDYFHASRNVGIAGWNRPLGRQLDDFFRMGWTSEYAEPVRPEVDYVPPRVSE